MEIVHETSKQQERTFSCQGHLITNLFSCPVFFNIIGYCFKIARTDVMVPGSG
jgi:hypothetical protein